MSTLSLPSHVVQSLVVDISRVKSLIGRSGDQRQRNPPKAWQNREANVLALVLLSLAP